MYKNIPIKMKIVVYSFEPKKLAKGLKAIQSIIKSHGITEISNYKLPSKIKKFTLNRSPHIDKKSREQFKMIKCRQIINIESSNVENLITAVHTVKHSLIQELAGIGLKIEFKHNTVSI